MFWETCIWALFMRSAQNALVGEGGAFSLDTQWSRLYFVNEEIIYGGHYFIISACLNKKKERESNIYCNLNSNDGLFWRYVLSKELLLLKDGRDQRQGGITCITTRPKVIHYVIMILVCHLCLELVRTLLIPNHVPCSYRKSSSSLWPASCVCASFLLRSCRLSSSTWGRNTPMPAPAALFCSWLK